MTDYDVLEILLGVFATFVVIVGLGLLIEFVYYRRSRS